MKDQYINFKMKKQANYTLLLCLLTIFLGCKKQPANPCDGISNQSPPLQVGMMLYDKAKGENLVLSKPVETTDIKVTELQTGKSIHNWRLIKAANSPLNGMLEIAAFHEKAGQYLYKVEIKEIGTVTIGYTISQEKTDNPCRTYSYPMSALKSIDHDFEPFVHQDKPIRNVIKVYVL